MFDYYIIMSDIEKIKKDWMKKWNANDTHWLKEAWELHITGNENINKNLDLADFLFIIKKIQFDNPDVLEYYEYLFDAIEELKESFPNDFYENFSEIPEVTYDPPVNVGDLSKEIDVTSDIDYGDLKIKDYKYGLVFRNSFDFEGKDIEKEIVIIIKKKKIIVEKFEKFEDEIISNEIEKFNKITGKNFIQDYMYVQSNRPAINKEKLKKLFESIEKGSKGTFFGFGRENVEIFETCKNNLKPQGNENMTNEEVIKEVNELFYSNKNQITHSSTSRYVKRMMKKGLIKQDGNKLKVNEQKDGKMSTIGEGNETDPINGGKRKTKKSKRKTNKKKSMKKRKMKKTKKSKK